ncbi:MULTISPECIES: hypothetical protein [unclassified Streptomyces]|uniref:hypothetical protein n=1 Tax=unclassified Streptomyces TaxID=2593676 RepID=UPI000A524BB0|nr:MULTISPECIES: hypothetical protein [unclassified Streptomyces]AZM59141.1 hypothetical protein DLM49_05830 [Streptomyces sp. WAC 01438]RSM96749.1 hypothetical protein DMA10_12935 [Streptomyces sp. WAC 01420]
MISLERAAELARTFVDEDPRTSQVDLIPIDGEAAVVDGAAYFGYQNRGYLETGDPSRMTIGIGPVRVDLTTGACRMLGAVEAGRLGLFEADERALPGPGDWRLVGPELLDAWRAAFDAEPAAADLSAPCPRCGARDLHRWYRVDDPLDLDGTFDGVRAAAHGWLTEWCAACHLCHEDGDTFVPDHWRSPYDVPEAFEMKFAPRHVEAARRAGLEAGSGRYE